MPLYYLSKLARKDVKVVLSGEGADELYGGYDSYYTSNLFNTYQKLIPYGLRNKIKNIANKKKYFKGQQFLIKAGSKVEDWYVGQAFIFDDSEANDILKDEYKTDITFKDITKPYFEKVKDKSDIIKKQFLDMNLWLPRDILLKADKMTMANSLELRVPFLDKVVFEHSLTIPDKYKSQKMCLRKASELSVPEEWAKRKKKGFPVPFSMWIRQEKYYKKIKDIFSSDYVKEFFNQEDILKLLEDHYKSIKNNGRKIYTIFCFLIWYKRYFIEN